jgi:uncharacterized protein YndB with AHSA1/START domain
MELAAASVTRSIELPVPADEAWASISSADGLAGWLGDAVELDLVAGAAGTIVDGDTVRRVVVTEVDAGRSVGFVWWDEAQPEQASVVTIALTPPDGADGNGRTGRPDGTTSTGGPTPTDEPASATPSTTVTVTERLAGAASASLGGATVGDLVATADAAWDQRLQALVGVGVALTAACV